MFVLIHDKIILTNKSTAVQFETGNFGKFRQILTKINIFATRVIFLQFVSFSSGTQSFRNPAVVQYSTAHMLNEQTTDNVTYIHHLTSVSLRQQKYCCYISK